MVYIKIMLLIYKEEISSFLNMHPLSIAFKGRFLLKLNINIFLSVLCYAGEDSQNITSYAEVEKSIYKLTLTILMPT